MSAYLVLVRHGKAEERREDLPDEKRHLTEAGRRALMAKLPDTLKLLPKGAKITLWSSPFARAYETAQVVLANCSAKKIVEEQSLSTGDIKGFSAELERFLFGSQGDDEPGGAERITTAGAIEGTVVGDAFGVVAPTEAVEGAVSAEACENPGKPEEPENPPALSDAALAAAPEGIVPADVADASGGAGPAQVREQACSLQEAHAAKGDSRGTRRACGNRLVIAVGHEPMIGELSERYCGVCLPFGKGAVACIRLRELGSSMPQDAPFGKLLWFAQGSDAKRWQVLVDLEKILADRYARVCAHLSEFRANPSDVEAVHQLRVSIRTLRSLVEFVRPFQEKRQNRAVQEGLRSLVRELSRLREYDVLAQKVGEAELPDVSDELHRRPLLDEVVEARLEESLRTLRTLGSKRATKILALLDTEFEAIDWRGSLDRKGLSRKAVRNRFKQLAKAFEARRRKTNHNDVEATHALRKQAKQIRYDAAAFKPMLGDGADRVVTDMKAVQDRLGDLCDARVNQALLCDFMRRDLSPLALEQASILVKAEARREADLLSQIESGVEA